MIQNIIVSIIVIIVIMNFYHTHGVIGVVKSNTCSSSNTRASNSVSVTLSSSQNSGSAIVPHYRLGIPRGAQVCLIFFENFMRPHNN